jgi:hypothetical protein
MSQLTGTRVVKGKSITFGLFLTNAGAGVDPGAFAAGDVKLSKNGAALANSTNLPVKIVGSTAGAHLFTLAAADTDTPGPLLVQLVKGGVDTLVAFVDVSTGLVEILDAVIEGPSQYDGAGEALPPGGVLADLDLTVAQALREIFAYCANSITGLDGASVVAKSVVGGRNRFVASMLNGNRTITSRNKT